MDRLRNFRRRLWRRTDVAGRNIVSDDQALARHMRALAVQLRTQGRTRLRMPAVLAVSVRRIAGESARIRRESSSAAPALERLNDDVRILETCCEQARAEAGIQLPACDGTVRILQVMRALVAGGDMHITRERYLLALASFDDVQALTMAEIWAAPTALRIALLESFVRTAESILQAGSERMAAERWIEREGRGRLGGHGAAFFERALQLALEREQPDLCAVLENCLLRSDSSPERSVRAAHEAHALDQMRLDNLIGAKRMLDELDGQRCFELLSRTEAELRRDPAGVYAAMDDESRAAVREQAADIARRLELGEMTVATQAVSAARAAQRQFGEKDVRATVCWWLYTDAGREELLAKLDVRGRRLPRMIPDPHGRLYIGGRCALSLAAVVAFAALSESLWHLLYALPLAWYAAGAAMGRLLPVFVRPRRLLKLEIDAAGEARRTLVVVPTLLSSSRRAEEMCAQLEELGCLEKDTDIDFMLLGDFRDGTARREQEDAKIAAQTRRRIEELNLRAGREKYIYLQRERTFYEKDGRWMGWERKRGALMALNSLLMGESGAERAFLAMDPACARLAGRYVFVVTLDADTAMLPGTLHKLIGALAHPLNRLHEIDGRREGYALLQPNMEMRASACANRFVRLLAGRGGMDGYPVTVSDLHQDLTGRGVFGGKGIYDLAAFHTALNGALPEGRILSHDLLEGLVCRAGFLSDVAFYDGFPASFSGYVRRLERWTRGDWQLLPFLFSDKAFASPRSLDALDRIKLLDNLLRSLAQPALLALFVHSVWFGQQSAFLLGLFFAFLDPILALPHVRRDDWRRALAVLTVLPSLASAQFGAACRAIWRQFVSGRHLLDWVTAADAENSAPNKRDTSARTAAILLLPGLARPEWVLPSLALAALFLAGPSRMRDLAAESTDARGALTLRQIGALSELARDTWLFFERYVTPTENGLPPDNVQLDPPVGAARRTSPTNIGLYLISSLAAHELGFIREGEMLARMEATVSTLERLEKWHGQLYNWYDIDALQPLRPRYVSAVDSGNLAACLLLAAQALGESTLSARMNALAAEMDFAPLFDADRKLFRIGADVENDRLSASHYDLLASESRILSYVAMMLGQIPAAHWKHLGRPAVHAGRGQALVSWSGTMFEYLMPELFMRTPTGTLIAESNKAVLEAQRAAGADGARPWGVSESGYYAFDGQLNYQYRAFGLEGLALGAVPAQNIVAPYASVLALAVDPSSAAENIIRMRELGWTGECGFYEAADYSAAEDGAPRLIVSHMAHHQGMALCALCNALTDDSLAKCFGSIPQARALSLLLEEKPAARIRISRRRNLPQRENCAVCSPQARFIRRARPEKRLVDAHMLAGGGAAVQITARGDMYYARNGIFATRFGGDFLRRREGVYLHVRDAASGETKVFGGAGTKVEFDAGIARYRMEFGEAQVTLNACISPEDGAFFHHIEARNRGEKRICLELTDCFAVALASEAEIRAHPAFQNLFVESSRVGRTALMFTRRPRSPEERHPRLMHIASGGDFLGWETDRARLLGRSGEISAPGGIADQLSGVLGNVLDPCSALRIRLELEAGETREAHFALGLVEEGETHAWMDRNIQDSAPERAQGLAASQARALLGFIGLAAEEHALLQRASAFLTDAHLAPKGVELREYDGSVRALWALGISGDLPVCCISVDGEAALDNVRAAIRMHEFYRAMGLWIDLVLINDHGNDYAQPLREAMRNLIACSHLHDMEGKSGGVWLLEGSALTPEQRGVLARASAMDFAGQKPFADQLRQMLAVLDAAEELPCAPMQSVPAAEKWPANGFGGFSQDGSEYFIRIGPGHETPAAWSNILAGEHFGALITERGGGFIWHENSRSGRVTPFDNDALSEGWGCMFYLVDVETREFIRLLPGKAPDSEFTVAHGDGFTRFESAVQGLKFCTELYVPAQEHAFCAEVTLKSTADVPHRVEIIAFADWLLGVAAPDAGRMISWNEAGACFASGSIPGVCCLAAPGEIAYAGPSRNRFLGRGGVERPEGLLCEPDGTDGYVLRIDFELPARGTRTLRYRIGWAKDYEQAQKFARLPVPPRQKQERFDALHCETPDPVLNAMMNHFLPRQVLDGRIRARVGLYQPGGAYGFRDQLQDMLAMIPYDPVLVRKHILLCAARQFVEGDVLHWWHMPYTGVRTRISDDLLFLPWVTACYVLETGDKSILTEQVCFLESVDLPEEKEDLYAEMRPSNVCASLHEHCMRAFRRAARTGKHGLALMGSGDWNDGMNRVGSGGRGESVWLTQFFAACAAKYAEIAPSDDDCAWLKKWETRMKAAVEAHGWDGAWYLRAYADDGEPLGSGRNSVCRIDAISQAWAVMAGLDPDRCEKAMDSAWAHLADEEAGIIKLLTPPFDGKEPDPGYIRGYPPGIRENGGQYTHAACWLTLALAKQNDLRAHRALQMLLPANHAQTEEDVLKYRVEPYVLAGDIYGEAPHTGRGGWTWYTGAAGWLMQAVWALLGYERRGDRVRMNALLGDWPQATLTVRFGKSSYRLVCREGAKKTTLDGAPVEDNFIRMTDDGRAHEAVFPPRGPKTVQ